MRSGSFRSLVSPALWSQDPEKISPEKAGPENKEGPDSIEGPNKEIPDKLSPDKDHRRLYGPGECEIEQ